MNTTHIRQIRGFTLLELLVVLGILAILTVTLIFVLNPTETFRKARDTQRLSDLQTLKTALGLYTTTIASPDLDAGIANFCLTGVNTAAQIAYSSPSAGALACTANVVEGADVVAGSTFSTVDSCLHVTAANSSLIDGTGWLPVNLNAITGGSPISNMPLDPTNTASDTTPDNTKLMYRYACQSTGDATHPTNVFEVDTVLESAQFGPGGADDRSAKDGGDNSNYYEVGSSVRLIGSGTNF